MSHEWNYVTLFICNQQLEVILPKMQQSCLLTIAFVVEIQAAADWQFTEKKLFSWDIIHN